MKNNKECIIDDILKERYNTLLDDYFHNIITQSEIEETLDKLRNYYWPTYLHCVNVCRRIIMIGILKDYSETKIIEMGTAGILLDVGYIEIPQNYLVKKTPLSKLEFEAIKKHPYFSQQIAMEIHLSDMVQQYILNHHESGNGGYYQEQDSGVLSVEQSEINIADKYEALLEKRPYREPMDHIKAIQTIYHMCSNSIEIASLKTLLLTAKNFT